LAIATPFVISWLVFAQFTEPLSGCMSLLRIYLPFSVCAVVVVLCAGAGFGGRRLFEAQRAEERGSMGVALGLKSSPGAESGAGFTEGWGGRGSASAEPAVAPSGIEAVEPERGDLSLHGLGRGKLFWEQQVESVERAAHLGDAQKARRLLSLLPSLPEEALETATQSAVRCLRDSEYQPARVLLLNPKSHGRVLSVLFADLLERRDAVVLPALISIARTPGHPMGKAARDNLEFLVGKDLGGNWAQWEQAAERLISKERTGLP
jgi:hypothetical protein